MKTDFRTYKTLGPTLIFFLSLSRLVKDQVSLYAIGDEMFSHAMLETETTLGISNRGVNTRSWLHGSEKSKRPKKGTRPVKAGRSYYH